MGMDCGARHSVRTEMPTIQQTMGVCPQDNVLFQGLSGASHLRFWARFRGLPRREVPDEVAESARACS